MQPQMGAVFGKPDDDTELLRSYAQARGLHSEPPRPGLGHHLGEWAKTTWPARIAQTLMSAATLPGDVAAGRVHPAEMQPSMMSGDTFQRQMDLAGAVQFGGIPMASRNPNVLRSGMGGADDAAQGGIRAYHASPHDFDRFDSAHIGTGQGTQGYGRGFYFSESPAVSGRGGDYDYFIKNKTGEPARIYEVNLRTSPDRLVDWEKPLSQQPETIQRALAGRVSGDESLGAVLERGFRDEYFAGDLLGRDRATATELAQGLREIGIDGVQFSDRLSRLRRGEDVRNYAVFDDNLVEIVRKYGLAALLAGGTAASALNATPAEASQGYTTGGAF
jgi:hypothetical protein